MKAKSPIDLFGLLESCDHDFDKMYDALAKYSTDELDAVLRYYKLVKTAAWLNEVNPCEALVLHVYNSEQSWGEREYADSYTRDGGFIKRQSKTRNKGNVSKFTQTTPESKPMSKQEQADDWNRLMNKLHPQPEPKPTEPKPVTDADFYIRACTVDWDCIVLDTSQVDLRKAAELVKLAMRTRTGIPVAVPALLEYHEDCDTKHKWRVVGKHTHAYAAIKLAKIWGSDNSLEWGEVSPCEASGMVRMNVLNCCSVGTGLGKEQPSEQYIADVLAMLD